ncbi:MAG: glycosyltransferase [Nocardioidaceae bacterium]|nr:glycosyltransferase [Nocardioidaceae bacterium]
MRPPWGGTVAGNRWDLAGPPADGLRVSVVVSHYEQPEQLARTLAALAGQTRPPDEVVVTDDGSAEPPVVPTGVRVVRQEDRGFRVAAARNRGVEATTGDLLVLLDADTTPEPGCVAALVDLPSRLPECLVVGRRRHADFTAGGRRELPEPEWLASAYGSTGDLLHADDTSHRFVIGAVLGCSRWWWDELGGCDETFTEYGGEDWDLAHRSWRAGGLLAHRPDAVAWHDGPDAAGRGQQDAAVLGETVAIADRIAVPGTGWRGLLRGPADVVVTCAARMSPTELVVTVDSLLAAVPTARVVLSAEQSSLVGPDARVAGSVPEGARLLVDLERGVVGDAGAWSSALSSLAGRGSRHLGVGTLTDLRLARRAERWDRPDLAPLHPDVDRSLTPWEPRHTLESWLGGWAR